jgi:hypothetical protein
MGRAELFRQTEDHVPDSVLLDFAAGCFSALKYQSVDPVSGPEAWCVEGKNVGVVIHHGETIRKAIKNAMGVG